jgi:CheY-like chemotaxis protein
MITPAHANGTIILVDDDHEEARFLLHSLEQVPCRVHFIHLPDCDEFLRYLTTHQLPPRSLVLLDLHFRSRLSLDVLRCIHENSLAAKTPIIVYSHDQSPDLIKQAIRAGAKACVEKPSSLTSSIPFLQCLTDTWLTPGH